MRTMLYIIIATVTSGFITDLLLSRKEKRLARRRRQMLEMENTEFDYGHNVRHTSDENI